MQTFDCIGGVDDAAQFGWITEEGRQIRPMAAPGGDRGRMRFDQI
jgi:hypothetical protein